MFNSSVTLFEARGDDIVILADPSFGEIERLFFRSPAAPGWNSRDGTTKFCRDWRVISRLRKTAL